MTLQREIKIYFRIPFTMYFVGKEMMVWRWSKLYLYRKEFDRKSGDYYFERV